MYVVMFFTELDTRAGYLPWIFPSPELVLGPVHGSNVTRL